MRTSRRSLFAAPLVAVVAPLAAVGCGDGRKPSGGAGSSIGTPPAPFTARWTVRRTGEQCQADEWMNCPPDVRCNPPPPLRYPCPPEMPAEAQVGQRADGTCVVVDTGAPMPCPQLEPPPPAIDAAVPDAPARPLRGWTVTKPGKLCLAHDAMACPPPPGGGPTPPCNPPAPIEVDCAPFPSGRGQIRETEPGACIAWVTPNCPPNVPCNPPPPVPFPCPSR